MIGKNTTVLAYHYTYTKQNHSLTMYIKFDIKLDKAGLIFFFFVLKIEQLLI